MQSIDVPNNISVPGFMTSPLSKLANANEPIPNAFAARNSRRVFRKRFLYRKVYSNRHKTKTDTSSAKTKPPTENCEVHSVNIYS